MATGARQMVQQQKVLLLHHSAIAGADGYRSLNERANVSFEAKQGAKGPTAVNVNVHAR